MIAMEINLTLNLAFVSKNLENDNIYKNPPANLLIPVTEFIPLICQGAAKIDYSPKRSDLFT
uniref:Uncharacterized protein n=1 Tax=Anguilla anguilla TaxID=7936 RepID=A0A0E9UDV2_ANGAN